MVRLRRPVNLWFVVIHDGTSRSMEPSPIIHPLRPARTAEHAASSQSSPRTAHAQRLGYERGQHEHETASHCCQRQSEAAVWRPPGIEIPGIPARKLAKNASLGRLHFLSRRHRRPQPG